MVGRTHIIAGITGYIIIAGFNPVGIVVAAVASKIPDIDFIFWHRGGIHSPICLVALYALVYQFYPEIALPLVVGFLSHLILDSLTPMGIPWLWPFYRKKIGLPLILTGSIGDRLVRWVATAFLLFLIAGNIIARI